jgi:hypothetical protein
MQTFLFDEYELVASISTIHRVLKKHNWSRKEVTRRAAERSEPLRMAWRAQQTEYEGDQLVFLDESASNERTGDRKRGYSPKGIACESFIPVSIDI